MNKWAWNTAVTDNAATNVEDPSSQRFIRWERGDKAFMWVKNTRNADMLLGDVVYFDVTDATSFNVLYLGDANTNAASMAGVVSSTAGIKAGKWGWIQVYGVNTSINTLGVVAANEVQTVTGTTAATAGTFSISVTRVGGSIGTTGPLAFNASIATIQTALDLASGVVNGIVATGAGAPMSGPNAMTLTYSGAGFASLPQPLAVIQNSGLTSQTVCVVARTTAGARASTVGDTQLAVSGQSYASSVAGVPAGVAPTTANFIECYQAYAVAVAALKSGFIHCLN